MAEQFQSLALVAIRKAVRIEPDEQNVAKYLELQGHIELSIGKKDLAIKSFNSALKIAQKFTTDELKELNNKIVQEIRKLSKEAL